MSKEFSVTLTSRQRWDLWLFLYRLGGVQPRERDQVRNFGAVCDTFKIAELQDAFDQLEGTDGAKMTMVDFPDVECQTGAVDLKRLLEYLDKMPEKVDPAMALRLLKISDYLQDIKGPQTWARSRSRRSLKCRAVFDSTIEDVANLRAHPGRRQWRTCISDCDPDHVGGGH